MDNKHKQIVDQVRKEGIARSNVKDITLKG